MPRGYSPFMRLVAIIVSFVLSLSLLVQNTCPRGYAGKTSVIRTCDHCPHKLDRTLTKTVRLEQTVKKQASPLPLFVLAVQERTAALKPAPLQTAPAFLAKRYRNAEPYELLRPPHA